MRVVAGSAGGIALRSPGTGTRPTMDRVKAAIFSSLGDRVPGALVLDLFAGSGALGIEALSRGAASAVFVDRDRQSEECIRGNLARAQLQGDVRCEEVFAFVKREAGRQRFDLIFADPPYSKEAGQRDFADELLASPELNLLVASEGVFVLERAPRKEAPAAAGWTCIRARRYGATEVLFMGRAATPEENG